MTRSNSFEAPENQASALARAFDPWRGEGGIKAIVGHYGSGKTEIALAMSLMAAKSGITTSLIDLDIVNPFFRSAEKTDYLEKRGVRMIAPPYALTGVDLPVLSAKVDAVLGERNTARVLDVGGDDAGAAALGRFKPMLDGGRCEVYYVVNAFRPFSSTVEQILDMLGRIENRSRLKVTALINNSNLADETSVDDVLQGQRLLTDVSRETGIPVACVCCLESVAERLPDDIPAIFPIERLLKPEWL